MPIDKFEGKLITKTRDQIRDEYLRDYKLRQPLADTAPGTLPHLLGTNTADSLLPMYANVPTLGDATTFLNAKGSLLDLWGSIMGRDRRPDVGAIGYVTVKTSSGGSNVVAGDVIKETKRNLRFRVLVTAAVSDGEQVGIVGIDTGPATNLDPGTEMTWLSPRAGMASTATVFENADGSGLTGGALAESDEQYQAALLELSRNPPAMGNESQVIAEALKIQGIAIQAVFVFPAVKGPGTKSIAFTMRPSTPGGSRLPNSAQLGYVESVLKSVYPFDDGFAMVTIAEQGVDVVLRATFKEAAASFVDQSPWPEYVAAPIAVTNAVAITATSFRVTTASAITAPSVGKTIALYNSASATFVAKRILTVSAAGANTWDLTFETTLPTSDTSFIPANGAIVSPWAASMQDLVLPVLNYFDAQGPGEMFASFSDPGRRQRRFPEPGPESWPSKIENRMLDQLFSLVSDVSIAAPTVPYSTTVGTSPALAYIHRLTDLAVYPQ